MTLKRVCYAMALVLALSTIALAKDFPAGTQFTVRINREISSATAREGDAWDGVLAQDVVSNGKVLAKSGASVNGVVVSAASSGRLKAPGRFSLRLTRVDGKEVHSLKRSFQGKSHTKSNATKIGGGAIAGALIGGLAGGGKGAAIGTVAGAGAGTGVAAATGKMEAVIPSETVITFTLAATAQK